MRAPEGTLTLDIETHSAHLLYTMPPEDFFRLGGYRWKGDPEVTITTDLEEMRDAIRRARWIVGHNIHAFDLKAIFGPESNEPVRLAMAGRVYDTMTHAGLVNPAPYKYMSRHGYELIADSPGKAMKWFGLDEQAFQLGVGGKTDDLAKLAAEYVEDGEESWVGFGRIPVDDPRYRAYLVGDVEASERVAAALVKLGKLSGNGERYDDRDYVGYPMREQEIAARAAVISSNGWRVDVPAATRRRDELAARRDVIVGKLAADYGLPTDSDNPWSTSEGKRVIVSALADAGITPETVDWPKTDGWENRDRDRQKSADKVIVLKAKVALWRAELDAGIASNGKRLSKTQIAARERWIERDVEKAYELINEPLPPFYGLSLSGETLTTLTAGTTAEELGSALAEVKGQRSLAQLTLDSVHPDGFVHPEITMLQASGRWSTTKPGLTIFDRREKFYYLPDSDDDCLLECDLSNADARVVAWLSGDREYAKRFEPGADGHLINAWAAWGKDVVGTDKHDPVTAEYRQKAKPLGHGWSYGGRPKTLSKQAKLPLEDAEQFCQGMDSQFRVLVAWQDRVRKLARRDGYVTNEWGRRMRVEKGREFTQAPALMGQSGTREVLCDVLLRLPLPVLRRCKASIHDALVFSVPRKNVERHRAWLKNAMTVSLKAPPKGQAMDIPAEVGPPGDNWQSAAH